jgi:hypothetical protein
MQQDRIPLLKKLEAMRDSKAILYATSDRPGMEAQISPDVITYLIEHLDLIGKVGKISLFLYTRGGSTLSAWSIVNMLRNFCDDLEVIVPFHCHSAGTLICLGANRIVMTKQASLGPIDPTTNGLMNPQVTVNGQPQRVPVSVEFVNGYLELVQNGLGIKGEATLGEIAKNLADKIHPLTLGEVYRSRSQIVMLAKKLLKHQKLDRSQEEEIIRFLCSESGSHDYTIFRKEARDVLGLAVDKPDDELYELVQAIYTDLANELELRSPFAPHLIAGASQPPITPAGHSLPQPLLVDYTAKRIVLESIPCGTHYFASRGRITEWTHPQSFPPQSVFNDRRLFEGWELQKSGT